MNKQRRHEGRAIRKQRREQKQMLDTVAAIDWDALGALLSNAMNEFGRVVDAVMRAFEDLTRAYVEAVAREYRMTYRALTTGREVDA